MTPSERLETPAEKIGAQLRGLANEATSRGRHGMCARLLSWAASIERGAAVMPLVRSAHDLCVLERDPSDVRLLEAAHAVMVSPDTGPQSRRATSGQWRVM